MTERAGDGVGPPAVTTDGIRRGDAIGPLIVETGIGIGIGTGTAGTETETEAAEIEEVTATERDATVRTATAETEGNVLPGGAGASGWGCALSQNRDDMGLHCNSKWI